MKPTSRYRPILLRVLPRLIWCLAICLIPLRVSGQQPIVVKDDQGQTIRLAQPARRIIALYGAFNEILAEMGLEDRIIARTKADRLPPSILDKPSIGTHMRPNVELVLAYKPDLVLQMAGRKQASQAVTSLTNLNVTTAFFEVASFNELFSVIDRLGQLTGAQEKAKALTSRMKNRLRAVRDEVALRERRPTVFFEVRYPNLLAAGQKSIVNDIIQAAGGMNSVRLDKKLVRIGEEELLRLDPDLYLMQKGPMNPSPMPIKERTHYQTIQAVHNGRVFVVDEQIFSRPGPRNIQAVETLAGLLYGPDILKKDQRQVKTKEDE